MTSVNPIFGAATPAVGSTPASSSTNTPASNVLGPNAFITLLTAQLQSQDPLNPMDPNQMVSELTSMNTLQQIIQIRQDMDALAGALQPASASAVSKVANQAFTASPVASSAAALYSQAASKS